MSASSLRIAFIGVCFVLFGTESAHAQRQVQKLTPANIASGAGFGYACTMSGNWAIHGSTESNRAYVFQRTIGAWVETQTLLPTGGQGNDQFGSSVAMDGDLAVVGAPKLRAAFVYERVGTMWIERQRLMHTLPFPSVGFGFRVAISGDRIAVHSSTGDGYAPGEVFIFERNGTTWTEVAQLQPAGLPTWLSPRFGNTLDIEGDTLVAGCAYAPYVYVYQRDPQGVWALHQQIPSPGYVVPIPYEGDIVALCGDTLFISALESTGSALNAGAAHVFERSQGYWHEVQRITPNDLQSNDQFLMRAVQSDVAIATSIRDVSNGIESGACYVFRRFNGVWSQSAKLLANDSVPRHYLGRWELGLDGDTLMAPASGDQESCLALGQGQFCHSGAVYFFEFPAGVTQYGTCNTATPCSNPFGSGGCRNSTGRGAVIQASGSCRTSSDDLVLEVRRLPPNTPVLFFMGDAEAFTILGAGQLRVGGGALGLYRLGVEFADAGGAIVRSPGLVASTQSLGLGAITAGQTWNFQAWYRDNASSCAPSNLSSALRVAFTP